MIEYKVITVYDQLDQEIEDLLNALGSEGWQVVGVINFSIILMRVA